MTPRGRDRLLDDPSDCGLAAAPHRLRCQPRQSRCLPLVWRAPSSRPSWIVHRLVAGLASGRTTRNTVTSTPEKSQRRWDQRPPTARPMPPESEELAAFRQMVSSLPRSIRTSSALCWDAELRSNFDASRVPRTRPGETRPTPTSGSSDCVNSTTGGSGRCLQLETPAPAYQIYRLTKRFRRNSSLFLSFIVVRGIGYRVLAKPNPTDAPTRRISNDRYGANVKVCFVSLASLRTLALGELVARDQN